MTAKPPCLQHRPTGRAAPLRLDETDPPNLARVSSPATPPTYDCADPDARVAGLVAAAGAVRSGRLVVLPTDTLYGLGADAFSGAAVRSLLAAKGRGPDMPVPVLVGSWNTIDGLVTNVPADWKRATVVQGASKSTVDVVNGTVRFDALPGSTEISLRAD